MSAQRILTQTVEQNPLVAAFEADLFDFFSARCEGQMERWEYWPASFKGDPAGGAAFWDALIKSPGAYYVPSADIAAIQAAALDPNFHSAIAGFDLFVELGAGSLESIRKKTLPLLKQAKEYIVLDLCAEQGEAAARFVGQQTGIPSRFIQSDYHRIPVPKMGRGKTAFIMWGCALGNIDGHKGEDATRKLQTTYDLFAANCNTGDAYIIPVDTEQNPSKVLAAYHEPLLSKKFLSVLFAAKKFGLVSGTFDPRVWKHRSEFYVEVGQCAHILYPTQDQDIVIRGQHIHIKAFEPRIENNSYKFTAETIQRVSQRAGFSETIIFPDRPMALTMSIK